MAENYQQDYCSHNNRHRAAMIPPINPALFTCPVTGTDSEAIAQKFNIQCQKIF